MLHLVWNLLTFEFVVTVSIATLFGIWVAYFYPKPRNLASKHVLITGGSSGIGLSLAIEAVKRGANVTLFARDTTKLEEARDKVKNYLKNPGEQKVACISVDVAGNYSLIERAVAQAEEDLGPLYLVVNCAGYAKAMRFDETAVEDIKRLLDVNYVGAAQVTRACVSGLKSRREGGIVFVSSQAGLFGVYGFASYSASKYALRGLAEALHMEMKPYNVTVTVSLPPDTDTPGFAEENKGKPKETQLICESAGLYSPAQVAAALLEHALQGKFFSTVGFEGFMLSTLCVGMSPVTSVVDLIIQVFCMGIFRLISSFYLLKFDRIVNRCLELRDQRKRSE